ncbi:MAG TPA: HAMP domain-containing sensor histidine kinase [Steroidobacter sp.]
MGRLFWKFFWYAWCAQLAAMTCGSLIFRWYPQSGNVREPQILEPLPLLVALVASLALAALLAWYMAKPIRVLREAFSAAEAGDLDVKLDPVMSRRHDELADLGRHFERMAARLRKVLDGQRRLLHDVSHEMRSPLARLQAAIGLARQQPEKLEQHFKRIELEAVRIDALVEELLTLARLQGGIGLELKQEICLIDVVNAVIEDCDFEARLDGGAVKLTDTSNLHVHGDSDLLHRAIENVVRNAVKHGGKGRSVTVALRAGADGTRAQLCVLDSGPGVPPEYLERIFEPFVRPAAAAGAEANGYGLGLTIARRIVDAHRGDIRLSNRAEGGLSVEILLPTTNVGTCKST